MGIMAPASGAATTLPWLFLLLGFVSASGDGKVSSPPVASASLPLSIDVVNGSDACAQLSRVQAGASTEHIRFLGRADTVQGCWSLAKEGAPLGDSAGPCRSACYYDQPRDTNFTHMCYCHVDTNWQPVPAHGTTSARFNRPCAPPRHCSYNGAPSNNFNSGNGNGDSFNDTFATRNESLWSFADHEYYSHKGNPVYYLLNHSTVGTVLSNGAGKGLQITMSDVPCKYDPEILCHGADMASDHVGSTSSHLYGDYEAKLRAPHFVPGNSSDCDDGIYGYFTAGYVEHKEKDDPAYLHHQHHQHRRGSMATLEPDAGSTGFWNEINFGFHPDRDQGGRFVSCEHHADTGGYQETAVDLGFNYRDDFHVYRVKLREGDVSWWVDGKCIHASTDVLSHPMSTRLIHRTNKLGSMSAAMFEFAYVSFTAKEDVVRQRARGSQFAPRPLPNATTQQLVDWHNANKAW